MKKKNKNRDKNSQHKLKNQNIVQLFQVKINQIKKKIFKNNINQKIQKKILKKK